MRYRHRKRLLFSELEVIESKIDAFTCPEVVVDFTSVLDAISASEVLLFSELEVIESKIDAFTCPEVVVNFTSVLDAISASEAILFSELEVIESKIDAFICPEVVVDFTSVLDAISESESTLVSNLELIESQLNVIESKIDEFTCPEVVVDFTSVLDAISASEVLLFSELEVIESKIDAFTCPEVVVDFTSVLDAISESEAVLSSELLLVESQLDVIESKIDALSALESPCAATSIMMPTTITQPGIYCVANNIAGSITISSSMVSLDLNGYQISMGITVTDGLNNVAILNGTVLGGSPGILVQAGCSDIRIQRVLVQDGTNGIRFEGVNGGTIEHCTLTASMTGLTLINSSRINVVHTVATANTYAGFDLVASSTNTFIECKAISTGQGNTQITNNFVFGFVSTDGHSNIFENCIANTTVALSTVDAQSIVAGFALRGLESCTKIIGSESTNAQASSDGVTVPCGIFIEGTLDTINSVTGAFNSATMSIVNAIDWSPDGQLLVVVGSLMGNNTQNMQVYGFDRNSQNLFYEDGVQMSCTPTCVDWSPGDDYIIVGGNQASGCSELQLYRYDRVNSMLYFITAESGTGTVNTVSWSPNGSYLAVGGCGLSGYQLQIFKFDKVTETLHFVTGDVIGSACINSVDWSPDGLFIVVGGASLPANELYVYSFNTAASSITVVAQAIGSAAQLASVAWSPDGYYVAVGGQNMASNELQIFSFTRTPSPTLILVTGQVGTDGLVTSLDWSADGKYVVIGGFELDNNPMQIFEFDRGTQNLNFIANTPSITSGQVSSVSWSPDGGYIASGGMNLAPDTNQLQMVNALTFPSKNIIKDNTVYCNGSGGQATFGGIGISGSSVCNMIIGNTAYNNPYASSSVIVGANYVFSTNVFNPYFAQMPSVLQNVSLDGCVPITPPEDVGLLTKQIKYKVGIIESITEELSQVIGYVTDEGTCLPTLLDLPDDINSLNLNVIQLLKTILLELRGCSC